LNQLLGRGMNVLGWDPIWTDRSQARFKQEYFKAIREAGFNHIRLNMHPLRDGKPDAEGKLRPEFFRTLDWAIDGALSNKLLVILDYHDDLAISPDPAGKKDLFLKSWAAIAEHCKERPREVLFEILNEPAPKFTDQIWQEYVTDALSIIRSNNPNRAVVIGPAMWNSIGHVNTLKLPGNDRQIIVTVHYYNPMEFTHQGTSWTGWRDKTGVRWEGIPEQQEKVRSDFDKAAAWGKEHDRPMYLGEFGAFDKAAMEDRARYVGFVAREAEKRNWSWAHWQFDGDFIAYDVKKTEWVAPIRDALIR